MGDPPGHCACSQGWRHRWSLWSPARRGWHPVDPAVSERAHPDLCGHRNVAVVISTRRRTRPRRADGRCDDTHGAQARDGRGSGHDADARRQPECGFILNAVYVTSR